MNSTARILITALFFVPSLLMAQIVQPELPANQIQQTFLPTAGPTLSPAAFINPAEQSNEPNWDVKLVQKGGIHHQVDQEDEYQMIKAQKTAMKLANEANNPIITGATTSDVEAVVPIDPVVLTSFEANQFDGWSPPDNYMAISDNGYIVSVINSAVSYYDENGNTLLADEDFDDFLSGISVSTFLFDPKVLYDPIEDKFIMVVLSGNEPSTSKVVVGFSVSENPMDGWYFYTFDGDYLDGSWFDFPNLGISEKDLFITGNLFSSGSGFDQVVVLQIDKTPGFVGGNVDWDYFNDVENGNGNSAFTVVPASYGYDGDYGPGIYMVSNGSFGGSNIYLYEVTDSLNGNNAINAYTINTSFYDPAGQALMLGSNSFLDTGGNRIRNAYYANGFVHFVFGLDVSGGYSGIRYNRLDVANLDNDFANFGTPGMDLGYPVVSPYSLDETSNAAMIGFLQSGSSIYPQVRVVNVDEDLDFSESVLIKAGESAIGSLGGGDQRWGDYCGGYRRHNSDHASAWFVGCYGQNNEYGNWIFEVSDASPGLPPIADFSATPKFGDAPLVSVFSDLSLNGVDSYEWTFEGGNPATSTATQPQVSYNAAGIYDVQLIATNVFGSDTILKNNYITASIQPVADFTSDVTSGLAPLTVNYENLSTNINANSWTFVGGNPQTTTDSNPTVVYNNPGTYATQLTVINDFGTDVEVKTSYITVGDPTPVNELGLIADFKVFPNPIASEFHLDFFLEKKTYLQIYIIDSAGKKLKTFVNGRVKAGQNILSFNKNALTAGTYFLMIEDKQQNIIQNEKIIIGK